MERYVVERLFDGENVHKDVLLTVENGVISSLSTNIGADDTQYLSGTLVPGFIDIQVNGGGGVQFNQAPSVEALHTIVKAHRDHGTTSMLPTIITDSFDVMEKGANAVAEYRKQYPHAVVGVHFEGPHLSIAKKGMHNPECIRQIEERDFALFCRKDLGKVLLTVAPESVSPEMIKRLTDAGVIVSLGHTNATAEMCQESFQAGATGVTHLYNAMSQLTGRSPGLVGTALLNEDVYCGLIVDHIHVHPMNSKLAIKSKGPNRTMLITDAMAPVGSNIDHFFYQGIKVFRDSYKLTLADGTIAGSVLSMIEAVQNTHFDLNIDLLETVQMASLTPARFLGISESIGQLKEGCIANMLLLNDDLTIQQIWQHGKPKK
ncbi:N-acetylglucosamine-6-phosphate deacetylase [Shewanella avicenniae]|uniref:N-acetylgalactosamine-6-phosphate deacetylase n=1 Tax=Shewanella avicenniae TaxID=2814294 RepID=A0ABX7QML9_9GAMM|nr:N-acetylglucosamine-6-phosphate deacetylase [Shewanella avicenniae]QSX32673.1 N-acetylglucosamine-6-phosphate deacetylase [Shewanella avicenniae]